ncbi:15994_t:CDS:10 [Acaulospora colombiana]|uniref:15994_t:CDS:1 n=1 Tax=Acaulospora colombiana TaxID=27376 RepID=A0ACA9KB45_9GLOM|nr:15994_t:CDS:10 [Acaulospora colombiana]
MSSRPLCLVWSPHEGSNQFLVDSNNDLRLYEYNPKEPEDLNFKTIVLPGDPSKLTCFAWSSDPTCRGLIASGYTNGKTFIGNFYDGNEILTNASMRFSSRQHSYDTYTVKPARTCSVVAFCPVEPRLLAMGYERWKNENSLLILDLEKAKCINHYENSKDHDIQNSLGPTRNGSVNGLNLQSRGIAATVDSQEEFHTNAIPTRAVYGLTRDPHREYRIASYDEGNICIWDERKTPDPISFLELNKVQSDLIFENTSRSPLASTQLNRNSSLSGIDSNRVLNEGSSAGSATSDLSLDDESSIPSIWKSRQVKAIDSSANISLFSWIPTSTTKSSNHFMGVNKDTELRVLSVEEAPLFNWGPGGNVAIYDMVHLIELNQKPFESVECRDTTNGHPIKQNDPLVKGDTGNRTPRSEDLKKDSSSIVRRQSKDITNPNQKPKVVLFEEMDDDKLETLKFIQEDISMVMRKRAMAGYSMDCQVNEDLVKELPALKSLWNWMALAEKLADGKEAIFENVEYNYHGVYSVWTEGEDSRTPNDNDMIMVPTSKLLQRKLSLAICGWGFGKSELESTLLRMEKAGNFEKAAGWALFHGETERAVKALGNSQDERLKLMSTTLASIALNKKETRENPLLQEICKRLSVEMDDPYLRAIFSYMASGQWDDVLRKDEIGLQDRIGIALRFLDDDKLSAYLYETVEAVKKAGDIFGVILTGLTPDGIILFENYLNNTSDVQTASLAFSFCVSRRYADKRVINWIEKTLLDKWKMFHCRARFDIARGKKMSSSEAMEPVPAQVYVRCNKCNSSIAYSLHIPGVKGRTIMPTYPSNHGAHSRPKA